MVLFAMGLFIFFLQAENGIRDLVRSGGLGNVYRRQRVNLVIHVGKTPSNKPDACIGFFFDA